MRVAASGGIVLLAAVASCSGSPGGALDGGSAGPDGPPPPEFTSGTRLRAMVVDGGGSAVRFVGWFDAKLGVACAFATAHDGRIRCLPTQQSTNLFEDPSCTEPAWLPSVCGEPPYVGVLTSASICPGKARTAVFPMGSGPAVALASASFGTLGSCTQSGVANEASVIPLRPEVDAGTFIAATESVVRFGDGSLAVRVLHAEDGSSQVLSLADARTSANCSFGQPPDLVDTRGTSGGYAARCVPDAFPLGEHVYADPGCTVLARVIAVPDDCLSGVPAAALILSGDGCQPPNLAVTELGAHGSSPVYQGMPGSCSALSRGWSTYEALGAMPPDAFGALRSGNAGTGRLRVPSYVDAQGAPAIALDGADFVDTELQSPCRVTAFSDGSTRCVPTSVVAAGGTPGVAYADPQCTQPLLVGDVAGGPCVEPPAPQMAVIEQDACAQTYAAYHVHGASPSVVYQRQFTECVQQAPDPSSTYYALSPIDDRIWATVIRRTE